MQRGGGFPRLTPSFHLPSPCIGPTDHRARVPLRWEVGQERAAALGARVPTDAQPQAPRTSVDLPRPPERNALTFGPRDVERLERLVPPRLQALPVFAKRLDDLGLPPGVGSDEKKTTRLLSPRHRVYIKRAAIGPQHTGSERRGLWEKRLGVGRIRSQDHGGGGIAEQGPGRVECDGSGLDHREASGKHLTPTVVDGQGAAVLEKKAAQLATGVACFAPDHFQRHVTEEPRRHGAGEIRQGGLGSLVVAGLVGDRGVKQGREAAVAIREGVDAGARPGRCQCQASSTRRDGPLAPTKLHVFATGVE